MQLTTRPPARSFHREYKPLGRLGLYLDRHDITYTHLSVAAFLLKIQSQLSDRSRLILLEAIKRNSQPSCISAYMLSDWRRGRLPLENSQLFNRSIEFLGIAIEDLRNRQISFNQFSFTSWVLASTADPIVLAELEALLQSRIPCPVGTIRLSKWINGHSPLLANSRALLIEAIECLVPECGDEVREILK